MLSWHDMDAKHQPRNANVWAGNLCTYAESNVLDAMSIT